MREWWSKDRLVALKEWARHKEGMAGEREEEEERHNCQGGVKESDAGKLDETEERRGKDLLTTHGVVEERY